MSLKFFHFVFIAASLLLSLGFSAWCFHELKVDPTSNYRGLGIGSGLIGLCLVGYGVWFVRKARKIAD